jgi:hypothetical protein
MVVDQPFNGEPQRPTRPPSVRRLSSLEAEANRAHADLGRETIVLNTGDSGMCE